MNSTSSWGVALCIVIEVYLRFGGTLCLLLQVRRINHKTNSKIQASVEDLFFSKDLHGSFNYRYIKIFYTIQDFSCGCMKSSVFWDMTPCNPKLTDVSEERRFTFSRLYGVML
jgi:hypothetical protein